MRQPEPLPYTLSERPFSVDEALSIGVTRRRLRSSDLDTPFWGIRSGDPATSVRDRCSAFLPCMPEGAVFSHVTAAAILGLPAPTGAVDESLDLGTPASARPLRREGIRGHRMRFGPHEVTDVEGIPVTTPVRTWVDLAAVLSLSDLVAVGDAILRRSAPLADRGQLHTAFRDHPFRRGRPAARTALTLLDGGAESPMESVLRVKLWEAGFSGFSCNVDILDRAGRFVARCDLVDAPSRLILEYEGDHHRLDSVQWHRDIERSAQLADLGWAVVRVTRRDLSDPTSLFGRVRRLKRP